MQDTLPSITPDATTEATPGSQDLPITPPAGDQLEAVSNNPDGQSQYIQTTPLATGTYIVQVSGYNGAFSSQPYLLQANLLGGETAPSCPGGIAYVSALSSITPASGPITIPADANTLFLVDTQRLIAADGASSEDTIMTDLQSVASDSQAGVVGAVIPVDAYSSVQAAYSNWDSDPCSVPAANEVVAAIAAVIDQIRAAYPTVQNLVIVGPDDQIPFARIADGATQSNERDYGTATFAGENNVEADALSLGYYFSDDPYAASQPLGVGSATLYLPQLAVGRLVESATEIESALTRFVASQGDLNASASLTTGYSFLTSGAQAVSANLGSDGLPPSTLISETWSESDLDAALAGPANGPVPGVVSINAHFDYSRALPADDNTNNVTTNLFTTTDVRTPPDATSYAGRLLFSMGCHAGLDVDDAEVAASGVTTPVDDWAKTFADTGALWVANTGYGYADTDTIAYSAKLMAEFAANLNGSLTIGEALTAAKQQYSAGNAILSPYDLKALMQSTFYGLPMYHLNTSGTPVVPPNGPSTVLDPTGLTSLTVAPVTLSPNLTEVNTSNGDYYENGTTNGGTQSTEYRPIEPLVTVSATEAGLVPHGALITGLSSTDHTSFTPAYSMPAAGSANSTPPSIGDAAFPGTLQRVATYGTFTTSGTGEGTQLDLVAGQFFPNPSSPGTGTQRLFNSISAQVYYLPTASSLENDFTPPTIDYSEASSSTSSLGFEVQVTPSAAPVDGVLVLYTDATTPGTWTGVDLSSTNGGQTWTGTGSPAPSGQVQYLVEAVDAAGNVAVSNNEGTDFNGAPAPSSISITLSGSGPTNGYYTSATVTADITAPSGSTYELDGSQSNSVPADGVVQVTGTGEHTITVTDPAGGTDTEEFAISTSETTVSLASSANPSAVGQTVTFNATVSPLTAGVGTPTGFVEFLDGGAALSGCGGTAGTTVSTSGVATCAVTYSSPSILPHTITAIYLGDSNFSESTSSTLNQTVDQAETTTTLSASPDPAVVGQPVTLTATVSVAAPGSGTPTGSVAFFDGGVAISGCGAATGEPLTSLTATCPVTYTAAAGHTITASYLGDSNFSGSTSSALTQTVNQAGTTTTLSSSANPSVVGQPITFTATVSVAAPGSGTPTGSVAFFDGGVAISGCGAATLSNAGIVTCPVTYTSAGSHTITAVFGGGGNFATSTSSALTQKVNQAGTTTTLSSSANPSVVGQPITFTATVSVAAPGSGTPTGSVAFFDGGVAISGCGAATLSNAGIATCPVTYTSAGSHTITAVFGGGGNFATSTSSALTQKVNQAGTTTSLKLSTSVATYGSEQSVTFTSTVSPQLSGTPSGKITIESGSTALCTITLPSSTCTSTTSSALAASVSPYSITAVYGGDSNFTGSSSASVALQVFSRSCITTSVAGPLTISKGQVICLAPGGKVTGVVTVSAGGGLWTSGGTITGALSSTGAIGIVLCGSTVTGPVSVTGSTGAVQVGGSGCAGDTITGGVSLTSNSAGVSFASNHLTGALNVSSNGGGAVITGNTETGNGTVSSNSGGVTFTSNTISGSLVITNNSGGFTYSANSISGSVTNTGNH